jgi:hypothetical protein
MSKPFCPRFFPKKVECLGDACAWYIGVMGKNPNTGEEGLRYGCAKAWEPTLMIEQSMTNRSVAGAIESFRNETIKGLATLLLTSMQRRELEAAREKGMLDEKLKQVDNRIIVDAEIQE